MAAATAPSVPAYCPKARGKRAATPQKPNRPIILPPPAIRASIESDALLLVERERSKKTWPTGSAKRKMMERMRTASNWLEGMYKKIRVTRLKQAGYRVLDEDNAVVDF